MIVPIGFVQAKAPANSRIQSLVEHVDQIAGIEILVAGPKKGEAATLFGHAVLRFVMNNGDVFSDTTVAFVAATPSTGHSNLKGLFGRYRSVVLVAPLSEFYLSYLNVQERSVRRYVLPTNAKIRRSLVTELARWESERSGLERYWFIGRNCTDLLLTLLSRSGIETHNPVVTVPSLMSDILTTQLLTALPYIDTIEPLVERGKLARIDDVDRMSTLELQRLYYSLNRTSDFETRSSLFLRLRERRNVSTLDEVYNLKALPPIVYDLCLDGCDVGSFRRAVLKSFPVVDPVQITSGTRELARASQLANATSRLSRPHSRHFQITQKIICDAHGRSAEARSNLCAW